MDIKIKGLHSREGGSNKADINSSNTHLRYILPTIHYATQVLMFNRHINSKDNTNNKHLYVQKN